jgi:hypothetical protein
MRASKAQVFGEVDFQTTGSVYPGWQRGCLRGISIRALGHAPTGVRPNRCSFMKFRLLATH